MASRSENLNLAERARIRNREIGFIFQAFNLIGDLTVYENVELPLTYREACVRRSARGRARRAGTGGDVASHEHYPSQFSAVNSSVWPWRGRWRDRRRSCWPTSPPETWIRTTAKP